MRPFLTFLLVTVATAAQAACPTTEIFSCQVKSKTVEVCLGAGTVTYTYGRPGKPELDLSATVQQAEYTPWAGVGRSIYEEVTFRNGPYAYLVWAALDRHVLDEKNPEKISGGVLVFKNEAEIASLSCKPFTIRNNIDALYEAKTAAGQCYVREDGAWGACAN